MSEEKRQEIGSEKAEKVKKAEKGFLKSPTAKGIAVFVGIIIVILAGFSAYSSAYDRILPNVTVNGIELGGMTEEEAKKKIDAEIETVPEDREIILKCGENSKSVLLSELKTRIASEKTARDAYEVGRDGGFFKKAGTILTALFKETSIPVEVELDEAAFDEAIKEVASEYETSAQKTEYSVEDDVLTITKGHNGKQVNRERALKLFKEAACHPKTVKIEVAVEETGFEDIDVDELYAELTGPVKNAEYKLENGEVVIVNGKPQVEIEKSEIKKAIESEQNTYSIKVKAIQPEITAKELEELLFRDVIGSFSSNFATSSASRASNVKLTADRINNYILMPGDVFSYDKTVGRRTVANGYKEAGVYIGNKVESGIGGGICQTSSTLYSAALYANLEIVQRTSHSLPVAYVPAGQDATIAEGYIDLKIKNSTEYPVKIVAIVTGRNLECRILGVKVPGQTVELSHWRTGSFEPKTERTLSAEVPKGYKRILAEGAPGYSVASRRIVKINGEVVKEEKLTNSVYKAANIEEEVNPADENTPSEQLKIYTGKEEIIPENTESTKTDGENEGTVEEPVEETTPDEPEIEDAPVVNLFDTEETFTETESEE